MHKYRTHNCNQLNIQDDSKKVRISGWVHRKRDHGGVLFIDVRDHYGITQVVARVDSKIFKLMDAVSYESVVTITGQVVKRGQGNINKQMVTGEIEIKVEEFIVESRADMLPVQVNNNKEFPEESRLKYRYIDLRRSKIHANILLRSHIIQYMRQQMLEQGFLEIQTPILTASSPEGARDFLVPSRLHPGKFYALPQAPQMFKQLLMVGGFDKYFQIAPCFRDEDARSDRSPGEFYQLDLEMAYVTQEDVFAVVENVLFNLFTKFSKGKTVTSMNFPRIPYKEAMLKYGNDKPDLRNPLLIHDVTKVFRQSDFSIFANAIDKGAIVRGIEAKSAANKPRSFFDKMNDWARKNGAAGLGYIIFEDGNAKGPIAKLLNVDQINCLKQITQLQDGDAIFFACDQEEAATQLSGQARTKIAEELGLIAQNSYEFCWIVDFPMFAYDAKMKKLDFSHNPFSMPQGGLETLETVDPLMIKAYQYDIVCNGIELSSGAIRNHSLDIMYKAFAIAGYDKNTVNKNFSSMVEAFKYGVPPHGGSAPGIDRIVMLLAEEENIREIIAFPLNQKAEDLMMQAPSTVSEQQLKDLHIAVRED